MVEGNAEHGISVIIPTCNGGPVFLKCLDAIVSQEYEHEFQIVIVDSGSTDGTPEMAEKAGAFVKRIDKANFHHAGTRNYALSYAKFNKVVYTVQDAIPCSNTWLSDLGEQLDKNDVAAAYTGQIPYDDAGLYARFEADAIADARGERPVVQHIESPESFRKMPYEKAYRTIGLDNVCAIYKKQFLIKTPFPEVDYAEDMAWALENLLAGHRILYQPNIKVRHSHDRPPEYIFSRQVTHSIWCARIMNRVRNDMSFLTTKDLMCLVTSIGQFAGNMAAGFMPQGSINSRHRNDTVNVIKGIQKSYSLKNRVRKTIWNLIPCHSEPQDVKTKNIEADLKGFIQHIVKKIRETYDVGPNEDVVPQVTAAILGRLFGEVYASCMLSSKTSSELDSFIRPYLKKI